MNNMFLQHLNSITPQGRAKDTKIFVPVDTIKKEVEDAENLRKLDTIDDGEELNEATRSKYLKVYGKHKVGSDESEMNLARLKRDIAVLRRGGADAETLKGAAASRGRYERNEKPDPSYNPHDAAMAGYRFANMASRSKEAGKKSPRKAAVSEEWGGGFQSYKAAKASAPKADSTPSIMEGFMRKKRLLSARTSGKTRTPGQRKALDTAYDSELGRRVARKLRKGGARKATVRGFFKDKPITDAAEKAFKKFNADEYKKHRELQAKGVNPKRLGFAEGISESSLGMKKGIRMANALYGKGREDLRGRSNAAYYRTLSKINKGVGGSGRIKTSKPEDYKFSEDEYRLMQQQAARGLEGKNKNYKQYYRGRR